MFKRRYDFDLIVIGSGAGGSVGAHYARSLGKKVALFEKGDIGGECPNWACVPTKALLHAAEVYETIQHASDYGINTSITSVDHKKVKEWKDLVVSRTGASHGAESFHKDGIELIRDKASFVSPHTVEADGKKYTAAKFLIATGSEVFIPPIPGLKESGYITFKEAVDFTKIPKSIFILGGGPIGCEFSQILSAFGTKVTIADNSPKLLAKEDSEVSDLIQALFEYRGIKVLTNILVTRVTKKGDKKLIHFKRGISNDSKSPHKNTVETSLEVDEILVASGKRAVLDFGPDKIGLQTDRGRILANKFLQTNLPHIFIAGDIAGPYLFTHTGYYQSYIAVNNAFSTKKIIPNYSCVPRCVFTKPEIASVGISEREAKEAGIKIKIGICATGIVGRANTSNEFDGFVKVITDKKGVIIGGSIVSPRAGEMIHEIALAVRMRVKASVLADMLHAYPTFSEAIKIACSDIA